MREHRLPRLARYLQAVFIVTNLLKDLIKLELNKKEEERNKKQISFRQGTSGQRAYTT